MAKTPAAKSETARERFLRLAPPRVDAALKRISLIGNLSGPGYEYEPTEIKQILDALDDQIIELKSKFDRKSAKQKKSGFAFAAIRRAAE